MPGHHRQSGSRLYQQVIRFHWCVFAGVAIAGDVYRDQSRILRPKRVRSEARSRRRAGRQVLDEHIGPCEQTVQQRRVLRLLDVRDQTFLAAIEPDEIARGALHRTVVSAREVTLGPFDLDHPGAGVRHPSGAIGGGDSLFEGDDKQAFERFSHIRVLGNAAIRSVGPRRHRTGPCSGQTAQSLPGCGPSYLPRALRAVARGVNSAQRQDGGTGC